MAQHTHTTNQNATTTTAAKVFRSVFCLFFLLFDLDETDSRHG